MPSNNVDEGLGAGNNAEKTFGADVYENAKKFNHQLAVYGPAALFALSKSSEHLANTNIVTGVSGAVIGAVGLFGNRYYRRKGDDTAYSYMGQLVGGIQFSAGFMLLTMEASKIFLDKGEPGHLLDVIKMATVALSVTQGALILFNSYLYGKGVAKPDLDPGAAKVKPH